MTDECIYCGVRIHYDGVVWLDTTGDPDCLDGTAHVALEDAQYLYEDDDDPVLDSDLYV